MRRTRMSIRDVAGHLNVGEKVIYRPAKYDLPGFKVAGARRFKRSDLDNASIHKGRPHRRSREGAK
jgi:hypothetical protein